MLKAYKRKKKELAKLKESYFKLETDLMSTKQKNTLLEQELSQTQNKLIKADK